MEAAFCTVFAAPSPLVRLVATPAAISTNMNQSTQGCFNHYDKEALAVNNYCFIDYEPNRLSGLPCLGRLAVSHYLRHLKTSFAWMDYSFIRMERLDICYKYVFIGRSCLEQCC